MKEEDLVEDREAQSNRSTVSDGFVNPLPYKSLWEEHQDDQQLRRLQHTIFH